MWPDWVSCAQKLVHCDAVLVALGRVPTVKGLGLEAAGVKYCPDAGIQVHSAALLQLP